MNLNRDKQLKFENGSTTEPLEIVSAKHEELGFGKKFVVLIKPTMLGHDHFLPSDGLIKKIKDTNADIGDKIKITKVAPDEKYPYGYFDVEVVEKTSERQQTIAEAPKEDKKEGSKLSLHELTLRVEKLEKITAALWTDYSKKGSQESYKKVGEEDIPF